MPVPGTGAMRVAIPGSEVARGRRARVSAEANPLGEWVETLAGIRGSLHPASAFGMKSRRKIGRTTPDRACNPSASPSGANFRV
jgi:hypothetical protein